MDSQGSFTREEIFSQPESWATAIGTLRDLQESIRDIWLDGKYSQVVFTGCGSTYYLALASAALMQELSRLRMLSRSTAARNRERLPI